MAMRIFTSIREAIYGSARRDPPHVDAHSDPERPEPHAIDIENHLDSMPGADHLNWRTSIVDLMDLLGVDSSEEARGLLAEELGYDGPAGDTVDRDNWLHTRVLDQLAAHGGIVPPEFFED
jgi:hypothetical protein